MSSRKGTNDALRLAEGAVWHRLVTDCLSSQDVHSTLTVLMNRHIRVGR